MGPSRGFDDEVLGRIVTLGSDIAIPTNPGPSFSIEDFDSFRRSKLNQRVLKRFGRLASSVCTRWRKITRSIRFRHLWSMQLSLSEGNDLYLEALEKSDGADLDVTCVGPVGAESPAVYANIETALTATIPYVNHIRSLSINVQSTFIVPPILSFAAHLHNRPRFCGFSMSISRYILWAQRTTFNPKISFDASSLTNLRLDFWPSPPMFSLPSTLKTMRIFLGDNKWTWRDISTLARKCRYVENFVLLGGQLQGTKQTTSETFPNVRSLEVGFPAQHCIDFLYGFRFLKLESLQVEAGAVGYIESADPSAEFSLPASRLFFDKLRYVIVGGEHPTQSLEVFSALELPSLQELLIDCRQVWKLAETHCVAVQAPRCLQIDCADLKIAASVLSNINTSAVEFLAIRYETFQTTESFIQQAFILFKQLSKLSLTCEKVEKGPKVQFKRKGFISTLDAAVPSHRNYWADLTISYDMLSVIADLDPMFCANCKEMELHLLDTLVPFKPDFTPFKNLHKLIIQTDGSAAQLKLIEDLDLLGPPLGKLRILHFRSAARIHSDDLTRALSDKLALLKKYNLELEEVRVLDQLVEELAWAF